MASTADAKVSAKQKSKIQRQLRKAVKKNPAVINRKSFLKKASLVNFKLPVTVRLRGSSAETNPNQANIDLGASLGQREIELGGKLAAEIVFHDSYDGGALGNVDVNILKGPKSLTSTSVPLLWNDQVNSAGSSYDKNLLDFAGIPTAHTVGCNDVRSTNPDISAFGNLPFGKGSLPAAAGPGLPGVPIYPSLAAAAAHTPVVGFAPAHIVPSSNPNNVNNGIDGILTSKIPGDSNRIGGNPSPFPNPPYADPNSTPGSPTYNNAENTVLRTNALSLQIADPGTEVNQSTNANGVAGSQNIVIGKSGGQANLFGDIPGKPGKGIDVTVNLSTKINSVLRVVDQDAFYPVVIGDRWPAAIFTCAQIWSGYVQNYIPGVHLSGSLKIAPAITSDGHLRIAKATLSSSGFDPARVALSACLVPQQGYNQETGLNTVPTTAGNVNADGTLKESVLPADSATIAPPPGVTCNSAPSTLVANSSLAPLVPLNGANGANGYTVNNSGSAVSVAGDLSVQNVSADILVGDV